MVLSQQFVPRVFADVAKLIIYVGDGSLNVGRGHDGVLIEREFLVGQLLERFFARGETFFDRVLRPLALRDLRPQRRVTFLNLRQHLVESCNQHR